ncbi:hypothetical protein [Mesorhizobium sp. ES1-4]|uniref:hypothetical protein n=1 Tax=Mesorhizobium sp. ES1-4 TaxID=2876627 RepID=UPI001CCD37C9|nr:hypothetical protein [Mesorhizobium sp. ES1-4]MBZ9798769.1 hypothetical protein [Mesorhizobium sp. ES1-4]
MGTGPGGERVAFVDADRCKLGWIAAGGLDTPFDRRDAVARLGADQRLGGDADIGAATREHAFNRVVEDLDLSRLGLCRLGPDLLFPLSVAVILRLALEDDIAAGEIISRCFPAFPLDGRVLAAVGNCDLERHIDIAEWYAGLAGFGIEEDTQQLDQLVAVEVFDVIRFDSEHAPFLTRPRRGRNDCLYTDRKSGARCH